MGLTPAIVIPDEQSWTVWGHDPDAAGLEPVLDVGRGRRLLLPATVPDPLIAAVVACLDELPLGVEPEPRSVVGMPGRPLAKVVETALDELTFSAAESHNGDEHDHEEDEHGDHGGGHDQHGEHDHDDMMAITGEPSADGLVMEPIELSLGPLASPLPGGLVADAVLDGDVVSSCTIRATLRQPAPPGDAAPAPPDLLAPVAWTTAMTEATEADDALVAPPASRWLRLARVELERAVSHLAWLRAFARLLGWANLARDTNAVLRRLAEAETRLVGDRDLTGPLSAARMDSWELLQSLERSRRLRVRTAGRGVVADARQAGLRGPTARASGTADDARSGDARYAELGFTPVTRDEGDARARTLVRTAEACAAIELAHGAFERARDRAPAPPPEPVPEGAWVETPRGPIRAQRSAGGWRLAAPGQREALSAAGDATVGLEWAAALVVLGSFDLSSWSVAA